jgi:PleD family two-component response regulator
MLLTDTLASRETDAFSVSPRHAQKVLIVNGEPESLAFLEAIVDAGNYDVVFVEAVAHAYSQVKRVKPDLVILCVNIDDTSSLQVLSMLRLDEETRGIPVLTYATDDETQDEETEEAEGAVTPLFAPRPAMLMN